MQTNDDTLKYIAKLEADNKELVEALDDLNNEFKRLPQSLGYRYTHTGKIDLLLQKARM